MILHNSRRTILVSCICLAAIVPLSPQKAAAQGAGNSATAGGTPNAFFRALQTIDAQQNAVAATRSYARPLPGARPTAYRTGAFRAPLQPSPAVAPVTASGQTPSSFYSAVRAIDSQQNAPYAAPAFAPTATTAPLPGATVAPSRWSAQQPVYDYRTATAPQPVETTIVEGTANAPMNVSILSTDYLLSYPQNAWRIISAPYNFDTRDWLTAGGIAATTGLLLLADKELNDTWRDDIRSDTLDDFLDVMENFGDSKIIIFGALGGYAMGELIGTDRDQEAALLVAQSFVLSAGLTQGLKFAFRRDRPDDSRDDQYSFFSSDASKTNSSFPSGHATNAFSMAAVLTNVYDESAPWLGWVLYPIAGATALARVNNERHWGSDVFLGSALGYFIGRMVVRYSPFRNKQTVSIEPISDGDLNGLRIVHKL